MKWRRRNYQLGGSKAVTYPGSVVVGEEATIAGDRLLLIDPRGEISEDELLEFMEKHVEPAFQTWWGQKEALRRSTMKGSIRAMEAQAPAAQGIQPVEMQNVNAGPQVTLVNCWRCGGQIAWSLNLGLRGACPYCGALIQLVT